MLVVKDLHAGYGLSEVLVGHLARGEGRHGGGAHRRQRRRQDHHHARHLRADRARRRARCCSTACRCRAWRPRASRGSGSPTRRRGARSSGRSRPRTTCCSAPSGACRASSASAPKAAADLARVYELFPKLAGAARPAGRHALGRRAADAGHRPGAHGAPQGDAARRAVDGAGAGDRAGGLPHHPAAQGRGHDDAAGRAVRPGRARGGRLRYVWTRQSPSRARPSYSVAAYLG